MKFRTAVELGGKTATGLAIPEVVVAALGPSRRPAVVVTIGTHTYNTTVASMSGRFLVPLSAANREAAGVHAGDEVEVHIELDHEPRSVHIPADLAEALAPHEAARAFFDGLAYTHRKEWVRWIEDAKKPQTRTNRLVATVQALRSGRRTR